MRNGDNSQERLDVNKNPKFPKKDTKGKQEGKMVPYICRFYKANIR